MKNTVLLVLIFMSQLSSAQTTWFVSNGGSNSNMGQSIAAPFENINYALSQASCGDSIYILNGTFSEKILATEICPENNRIILQGDINGKPLIIGDSLASSKYAVSALGSGYYFRNLRMTSPYPNQCSQSNQVIVGLGDHFTFDDVIIFNSGYDGIKTYGDCNTNNFATNWKVINSEIYNCGLGCPSSIVNGDGIDFTQCHDCLIENSVIKNNMGHQLQIKLEAKNVSVFNSHIEGRHLFQIGLPGAVPQCDPNSFNADSVNFVGNTILAKGDTSEFIFKLADVSHLNIHNNTIIKDSIANINVGFICFGGCSGTAAWTNTPTSPIEIKSNIFVNFADSPLEFGADTAFFDPFTIVNSEVDMDYNLFYDVQSPLSAPTQIGLNSIVSNPLFCDYPTSFELSNSSPCINNGDPSLPSDPDNSQNDIGAKYYQTPCVLQIHNDDLTKENFLVSFPNPANDIISVKTKSIGTISLLSPAGQVIYSKTINHEITQIDMSKLSAGMYFLLFEGQDTSNQVINKVIKQ